MLKKMSRKQVQITKDSEHPMLSQIMFILQYVQYGLGDGVWKNSQAANYEGSWRMILWLTSVD